MNLFVSVYLNMFEVLLGGFIVCLFPCLWESKHCLALFKLLFVLFAWTAPTILVEFRLVKYQRLQQHVKVLVVQ